MNLIDKINELKIAENILYHIKHGNLLSRSTALQRGAKTLLMDQCNLTYINIMKNNTHSSMIMVKTKTRTYIYDYDHRNENLILKGERKIVNHK